MSGPSVLQVFGRPCGPARCRRCPSDHRLILLAPGALDQPVGKGCRWKPPLPAWRRHRRQRPVMWDPGGVRPGRHRVRYGRRKGTGAVTDAHALPTVPPTEQADPAKQARAATEARALDGRGVSGGRAWRGPRMAAAAAAGERTGHAHRPLRGALQGAEEPTPVVGHGHGAPDGAGGGLGAGREAGGGRRACRASGRYARRAAGRSSIAAAWGENTDMTGDDSLTETGTSVSHTRGGLNDCDWTRSVLGPVGGSTSVCGVR